MVLWSNPVAIFAGNLTDRLSGRVIPEMVITSAPDHRFWHGVDICTPFPGRGLLDSVFAHAALLGLLYAVSFWPQCTSRLSDPLSSRALTGYTLSEYLPELHSAPTHARPGGKADPVSAKQQILSLPEPPDNFRQTIVTPPPLRLQRDIDLPNVVAYQPPLPVQPLAASQRDSIGLRFPRFVPDVVGPAADASSQHPRSKLPTFEVHVVEPAPDVAQASPRLALPLFQPKVVERTPDLGSVNHGSVGRATTANFARLIPQVAPVPDAPDLSALQRSSEPVLALSLHPSEFHGPVELPPGNRRGEFAASPDGRPEATGAPGANAAPHAGAPPSKSPANAPSGISVTAAPPFAPIATKAGTPNAPSSHADSTDSNLQAKLNAAIRPPATTIPPRPPLARDATGARNELENRIFAGRRSYTMSVNMPNLNTATGSWIIHFVERQPGSPPSPIAAPEVVRKSDPAYPGELIQDGIQGTVILRAIIRADGSVGDIAIVKSLDSRLDRNAAQALSRWLFRPALKNGQAIDLEAVITVPFRTHATRF